MVMVKFDIKEHYLDRFIEGAVADGVGSVLTEEGCRRFDVVQDLKDHTKFAFTEAYDNKEAFEHHVTTHHFLKFHRATRPTQVSEPVVSFCRVLFPANGNFDSYVEGKDNEMGFGTHHIRHSGQHIQSDYLAEYLSVVMAEAGEATKETSCLRFDVYQNLEVPNEIYTYEVYEDVEAYNQHQQTSTAEARAKKTQEWGKAGGAGELVGRNIWPPNCWNFSSEL